MSTPRKALRIPAVSKRTRRVVSVGVAFAGICAAAMSAPTLYSLARLGHVPAALAWLLPACLDGYAFTSIQFGHAVPAGHPARTAAKRNARVALLLTVLGNAAYHLLVLAAAMLPSKAPVVLLVVILSLPPFIVDRLMHLHSLASGAVETTTESAPAIGGADSTGGTADGRTVPMPRRRPEVPTAPAAIGTGADMVPMAVPTKPPTAPKPAADDSADRGADVIDMAAAGAAARRNTDAWAADALPVYRRYLRANGTEPNAPQLAAALEAAGLGTLGARDVRKATEALHRTEAETETEPERAEAVS
jgi:hypothetical protein